MKLRLSDDHWVQLHDPALLTNGQHRPIAVALDEYNKIEIDPALTREYEKAVAQNNLDRQAVIAAALRPQHDAAAELRVVEVTITVLVEVWSLDMPLPSANPTFNEDGQLIGSELLDELRARDYDILHAAATRAVPSLLRGAPRPHSRNHQVLKTVESALRAGKFERTVPEEWREYRALKTGTVAPQRYDDQIWHKTDLFAAFAHLEHEAEQRAAAQRTR